jgi:hypothetical protein
MKLYQVTSENENNVTFHEFTSSAAGAGTVRARLKKAGHEIIDTKEVDVTPTRDGIITFLNGMNADATTK